MTVNSLKDDLCQSLQTSLDELESIWEYIGYEPEDRARRSREISDRVRKCLSDVIQEENRFRLDLEARIDAKKREIADACQLLSLANYFPPRGLTSYRLIQVLDDKASELNRIKEERRQKYTDLRGRIVSICTDMGYADPNVELTDFPDYTTVNGVSSDDSDSSSPAASAQAAILTVPREEQLDKLAAKLSQLEAVHATLTSRYQALRDDLLRIANDIDYNAQTELEQTVLWEGPGNGQKQEIVIPTPLNEALLELLQQWRQRLVKQKAMLVSTCNELRTYLEAMWARLDKPQEDRDVFLKEYAGYKPSVMEALQEEVDRCQQLKWERMESYLGSLCTEANTLYSKCCMDKRADPEMEVTEEAINSLEQEIEKIRDLYDRNRTLYDTIATYHCLWEQYVDVEARMKDPSILSNRGGIMLKTENERKRLLKELPKVEQGVSQAIADYEAHAKTKFLLQGRTFSDYVQNLWIEFKASKETNKFRRSKTSVSDSPSPRELAAVRTESTSPAVSPKRVIRR